MFMLRPIGRLRSELRDLADAPRQGNEGAPDAWLVIEPDFATAVRGIAGGHPRPARRREVERPQSRAQRVERFLVRPRHGSGFHAGNRGV